MSQQPTTVHGMSTEETWRWRIRWGGKLKIAPGQWTEAEIRREHPDAVRVEASMVLRQAPGSAEPTPNRRPATEMDPAIARAWTGRTSGKPPKVHGHEAEAEDGLADQHERQQRWVALKHQRRIAAVRVAQVHRADAEPALVRESHLHGVSAP